MNCRAHAVRIGHHHLGINSLLKIALNIPGRQLHTRKQASARYRRISREQAKGSERCCTKCSRLALALGYSARASKGSKNLVGRPALTSGWLFEKWYQLIVKQTTSSLYYKMNYKVIFWRARTDFRSFIIFQCRLQTHICTCTQHRYFCWN